MQLELIGCTGAGKSTLAASLVETARSQGLQLELGDDVVLKRLGLCPAIAPPWRKAAVHFGTLLQCASCGRRYRELIATGHRSLRSVPIRQSQRWNQLRKLLKQLGRYELIRRTCPDESLVLVDEGTVQSAHNLFVHVEHCFDDVQLREFSRCVPLPDLVVYVRPNEDELIERTLRRGHPRIARPTRPSVTWFVRQALSAFDQLTRCERVASRTIEVRDGEVVYGFGRHRSYRRESNGWSEELIDLIRRAVERQSSVSSDSAAAQDVPAGRRCVRSQTC